MKKINFFYFVLGSLFLSFSIPNVQAVGHFISSDGFYATFCVTPDNPESGHSTCSTKIKIPMDPKIAADIKSTKEWCMGEICSFTGVCKEQDKQHHVAVMRYIQTDFKDMIYNDFIERINKIPAQLLADEGFKEIAQKIKNELRVELRAELKATLKEELRREILMEIEHR